MVTLLGNVAGGAVFGLMVRFWQLGIQRKPIFSNFAIAHTSYMAAFGFLGYWEWHYEKWCENFVREQNQELAKRHLQSALRKREYAQRINQQLQSELQAAES